MSAIGLRGHQVRNANHTATDVPSPATAVQQDAARVHISAPQPTSHLQIRNTDGANAIRVYWTAADFSADTNFITVNADAEFEGPAEVKEFWTRCMPIGGALTAAVEAIFYFRRG